VTTDPFAELNLDRDSSPEIVRARWRQLASEHHPDKGGSLPDFLRYQEAYRAALKIVQDDPCPACGGRGVRGVSRGFSSIDIQCDVCGGSKKRWKS
jgi:DnaJ-class molecular chaperone